MSDVELSLIIKALDQTKAAFTSAAGNVTTLKSKVATGFGGMVTNFKNFATGATKHVVGALKSILTHIGPLLGIVGFAGLGLSIKKSVDAFGEFDTGMKTVQKTTGMAGDELAALGDTFKEMSKEIPKSAAELADIGAVAGQLGIQGAENIAIFTKTISEVSVAMDMTAEDAATSMAKIAAAFQEPVTNVEKFGSAINALENTTAAAGVEIIGAMTRMAASGAQLGLTTDQAAALGATLIAMGIPAEKAGTELNTAFTKIALNWDKMAAQMGMSTETAAKMMEEDFMGFFLKYLGYLNDAKPSTDDFTRANDKLAVATRSLGGALKDEGAYTDDLIELEEDVSDALGDVIEKRQVASKAIADYGADSEIAKKAILDLAAAEQSANTALLGYNAGLSEHAQTLIDSGVASSELTDAFADLKNKAAEIPESVQRIATVTETIGAIGGKAVLSLASSYDPLITNLQTANEEYEKGTALSKEAEVFYGSFENQMKLLKDQFNLVAISIGEKLAPALLKMGGYITDNILPAFMSFVDKIGPVISKIGDELWPAIEEVGKGIARTFADIAAHAKEGLSALGTELKETVIDSGAVSAAMETMRDIGVLLGEVLGFVADKIAWLIDWLQKTAVIESFVVFIGGLRAGIHALADQFRDEEDYIRGVEEATNDLEGAKRRLIDANKELYESTTDLADSLKDANMWTAGLTALEQESQVSEAELTKAREEAAKAIEDYGKDSPQAIAALKRLETAEHKSKTSTEKYQKALEETVGTLVETGVASDDLEERYYDFIDAGEDVIDANEDVIDSLEDVEDAENDLEDSTRTTTDNVAGEFRDMKDDIAGTFSTFGSDIKSKLVSSVENLSDDFIDLGKWIAGKLMEGLEWLWDLLPDWIKELLGGGGGGAATSTSAAAATSTAATSSVANGTTSAATGAVSAVSSAATSAVSAVSSAVSAVTSAATNATSAATSAATNVASTATSAVSSVASAVNSAVSSVASAATSIASAVTSAVSSATSAATSAVSSAVSAVTSAGSSVASAVSSALGGLFSSSGPTYQSGELMGTGLVAQSRYNPPQQMIGTPIDIAYNFNAPIYGVDNLKALLEEHDRDLLKKIERT